MQFLDAGRGTFDLHQGDHIITVRYGGVPAVMKPPMAAASTTRQITVAGTWQQDDSDNSYYIVAQTVDAP